ncbi:uncharacterized protein Bfra_005790 [Botrytis fragariae]|uniref:Myb-like DNA-binding domain-containing protein n=1 Tax=Botrytis fragariae TaxID=1964551 RepID=A0A8H6EHK0_9HELO|nr:uncharacterized protein Bfra_005790 [Botrytis fragariae]KAF5872431.1 hypothetical protein Bfra_005790 [Botrytis fragariae]
MPSKIQLDENLVFLYICLQKSDMKTIDFAAVGQTTNLKSPAARMRYTRLKRQIEKGVIGANANINLGGGSDERGGNGEEKERRKAKREKKMREKKEKEERKEREGVEKKEKVEAKEWNGVEGRMGMGIEMKLHGGVEKKEGKRKREIEDNTESDADAISEPDFQLHGWNDSTLNNATSPFPPNPPPSTQLSTHPQTEHLSHPYIHNYPAASAPQTNISQSDLLESQPISQTLLDQLPLQTSSAHPLDPQIKLEPYSPFSSFSSYSTERSLSNFHEHTTTADEEDADSEDEMPLAKRRGMGKRHTPPSQSQSPNGDGNTNPSREITSHRHASKTAGGYRDAHSHSHSCSEMRDPCRSGRAEEYTYTRPPLRDSLHESGTSSQYAYAYAYPNPYTAPYKSIYAPPASPHGKSKSSNTTPSPSSPSPPSKFTPPHLPPHPQPYNWADTYQSYRHLWGTERIARVSPPLPSPSVSSCSSLPLYHTHNHDYNHNNIANTTFDSDFPPPHPIQSPRPNTHLSLSQW